MAKSIAAKNKADKVMDKAKGIKEGSPRDLALDKKAGVFNFQYGNKKGRKG